MDTKYYIIEFNSTFEKHDNLADVVTRLMELKELKELHNNPCSIKMYECIEVVSL